MSLTASHILESYRMGSFLPDNFPFIDFLHWFLGVLLQLLQNCINLNMAHSLLYFSGYKHASGLGHTSLERWDP